jgi:hypothetical protein
LSGEFDEFDEKELGFGRLDPISEPMIGACNTSSNHFVLPNPTLALAQPFPAPRRRSPRISLDTLHELIFTNPTVVDFIIVYV